MLLNVALTLILAHAHAMSAPDSSFTPGVLCSSSDQDFQNFDYPEHVARCKRKIEKPEKEAVAKEYGNIPEKSWPDYEFDHLLPLCAGGSNDIRNLWPQPIDEAKKKDVLENDICLAMKAGTLTQSDAVEKVHAWFAGDMIVEQATPEPLPPAALIPGQVLCQTPEDVRVRFQVSSSSTISQLSIRVTDAEGEHEAIHSPASIKGQNVIFHTSQLLSGFERYAFNEDHDRFDVYLPKGLNLTKTKDFKGYLKIQFEGNLPKLSNLDCQSQP